MGAKTRTPSIGSEQIAVEELLRETLSTKLVAEREARGWTQEALAEKAGVHWTTIGKIERGRQLPSLALLVLLARALELNVGSLLSFVLDEQNEADDPTVKLIEGLPRKERESLHLVLETLVAWKRS